MPDHRSPLSWDWDDDSLLPKRGDYSEAEIQRMEVAADRRRAQAAVHAPRNQSMEEDRA